MEPSTSKRRRLLERSNFEVDSNDEQITQTKRRIIKEVNVRPYYKLVFTYLLDKLMEFNRSVHYSRVPTLPGV